MDNAYLFPFAIPIDDEHVYAATPVTLHTGYDELLQASHHRRLRCSYIGCLEQVKPVRRSVDDDTDLRCFAHVEPASMARFCPYRTESDSYRDEHGHRYPREHNLRKWIENDLRFVLEQKLRAQGHEKVVVRASAYHEFEPLIRVTGLDTPLQIRGLGPGCEALWSQPFDGTVDGEPVLFFVISPDAPRLQQPFIDDHLLARRPAILVKPMEKEGQVHRWIAMPALKGRTSPVRPFDEIDLIRVDYRRLFGLERSPEMLFIPTPYREAIERIATNLDGAKPPAVAMLRSFAERLLVQGAGVRAPVFGHEERTATEIGALLEDPVLRRFCGEDELLADMWTRFFVDAFAAVQQTVELSREELAKTQTKLAAADETRARLEREVSAARSEQNALAARLSAVREDLSATQAQRDEAVARVKELDAELARTTNTLDREKNRRAQLEQDREELSNHWLVRLDAVLRAPFHPTS